MRLIVKLYINILTLSEVINKINHFFRTATVMKLLTFISSYETL